MGPSGKSEAQDRDTQLGPQTLVSPFPVLHLNSVLVNLLIGDLPGTVPPHLGDSGLILETVIQAEGCNHVLEPLGAGKESTGKARWHGLVSRGQELRGNSR